MIGRLAVFLTASAEKGHPWHRHAHVAIERWLVSVDTAGAVVARRRSPKRGLAFDLFDELVHIPTLIDHAELFAAPESRDAAIRMTDWEIAVQLPDGASLDRTQRVLDQVTEMSANTPGVAQVISIAGISALETSIRTRLIGTPGAG